MSVFIEVLKCILCCVEDHYDDVDDRGYYRHVSGEESRLYNSFVRRSSPSYNDHQTCTNSTLINPNGNDSMSRLTPSDAVQYRVVLSSRSSNSGSVGSSYSPYVPTYSHSQPPSSSKPPQSSSKLLTPSSKQSPSLLKPTTSSSSKPSPLPFTQPTSSSKPFLSSLETPSSFSSSLTSPELPTSSSSKDPPSFKPTLSPAPSSSPKLHTSSFKQSPSLSKLAASTSSSKPSPLPFTRPTSSSKPLETPSSCSSSLTLPKLPTPSSSKDAPSFKPTLSPAPSNLPHQHKKATYICVQKGTSPIYMIPKDIEDLIRQNKVPQVLNKPLSPLTYKDYFAALLYAEDFYIEKWKDFELLNVTLELREASIYKKSGKNTYVNKSDAKNEKTFVAFEMDSAREKRPFLLSRDFVFARPSGRNVEPFKGIIYRVVKSTVVLVEFGEDFYSQHHSTRKYDVSFSFNRVCLKRAHQAIEAASDPLFKNFLFPDCAIRKIIPSSSTLLCHNHKLDLDQNSAVHEISSFQGTPPYLVEGPLCVTNARKYSYDSKELSRTGLVVQEAVLQIYQCSASHRILICAPINSTCDMLMRCLKKEIPESDMFRANAAFREVDGVPIDILPSCLYERDCFACPSLQELRKFRVILSTFVSSFRLHNEGINAGHFSHIFMVDASSATEPEAMVALANLANEKTAVVVTGAPGNRSGWIRSDIARQNGLRMSYFERLRKSKLYGSSNPAFITKLVGSERESEDTYSCTSFSYM